MILCVKYEGEILLIPDFKSHITALSNRLFPISQFLSFVPPYTMYQAYIMYLGRNKCASILQGLPDPDSPFSDKKRKAQPISCLGSELVCHSLLSLLFFRNFNDDVVWMFLLLCLATKTSSTIPNSKEVQCEQAARRNPVL